jgi:hypothetical protein
VMQATTTTPVTTLRSAGVAPTGTRFRYATNVIGASWVSPP